MDILAEVNKFLGLNQLVWETIRSCLADMVLEKGEYSQFSKFALKRSLGSRMVFDGFKAYSKKYLKNIIETPDDVFNVFSPELSAVVLASYYIARRAIKVCKISTNTKTFKDFLSQFASISLCFGKFIPEVGLIYSTLYGSVYPSSISLVSLLDKDAFNKIIAEIESSRSLNFKLEDLGLKISIEELGGTILQAIGFGKHIAEAYTFGLLDEQIDNQNQEKFASLHFWVRLFFKEDPLSLLDRMSFEVEEEILNNMLKEISKIKEIKEQAWFLFNSHDDGEPEALDDILNI